MTTRPINLSRAMEQRVHFARFSKNYRIRPTDLAEIVTLALRAVRAQERECNTGKSSEAACLRFEAKALKYFDSVEWPGLYPEIKKDGRDVHLPY